MGHKITKVDKDFASYVKEILDSGSDFKDGSYKRFGKTYVKNKGGVVSADLSSKDFLRVEPDGDRLHCEYLISETVHAKRIEATQMALELKTLSDMGIDCTEIGLGFASMKTSSGKVITITSGTPYTQSDLENLYLEAI